MKRILILFLITAVFAFTPPPAAGQVKSALKISPVIFNISLSPGKVYRHELKIRNMSDAPAPVQINMQRLNYRLDDEVADSPLQSLAPWVHLEESNMIIEPHGERVVHFTITVPDTIPLGGYYGMLEIQPLTPLSPSSLAKPSSDISSMISIIILGSIGVQEVPLNKIDLQSPHFSRLFNQEKSVTLQFAVKNNSLNHVSAKPFLRIFPLFSPAQDVSLEEKLVFPGRIRTWEQTISLTSYPNLLYRADLMVSVGGGQQKKATLYFLAFPFIQTVLIIFIVGAAMMAIKHRKRLRRALRILIRG